MMHDVVVDDVVHDLLDDVHVPLDVHVVRDRSADLEGHGTGGAGAGAGEGAARDFDGDPDGDGRDGGAGTDDDRTRDRRERRPQSDGARLEAGLAEQPSYRHRPDDDLGRRLLRRLLDVVRGAVLLVVHTSMMGAACGSVQGIAHHDEGRLRAQTP
jgi:hypothetical protein